MLCLDSEAVFHIHYLFPSTELRLITWTYASPRIFNKFLESVPQTPVSQEGNLGDRNLHFERCFTRVLIQKQCVCYFVYWKTKLYTCQLQIVDGPSPHYTQNFPYRNCHSNAWYLGWLPFIHKELEHEKIWAQILFYDLYQLFLLTLVG